MAKTKLYTYILWDLIKACVKMSSLAVRWMPSSNLWRMKNPRSGQVYHTVLPGKAYYSC